jgi:rhodanese-related sulfurtransferase
VVKAELTEVVDLSRTISHEEILARLQDRALAIVNVMPRDSFKAAHIPGSLSLPISDIDAKARQLLADLNQEIVIYCAGPT